MQPIFYATSQQIIASVTQMPSAMKNRRSSHLFLSFLKKSLSLGLDFTTKTTDLSEKPTFGVWAVIVIGIAFPNNMFQCLSNMNYLGFSTFLTRCQRDFFMSEIKWKLFKVLVTNTKPCSRYDSRLKQRKLGCWVAMASYQTLALSSPSVPWQHVERE